MSASVTARYEAQRSAIAAYFDRTAVEAWARLTSDGELGRIRAAVRAGRARMRAAMLAFLPADLSGVRVLDAGCGTGALAVELAARGATVLAIDLSPQLINLARTRVPEALSARIAFRAGDMLEPDAGRFDHVVAMDSLIHYAAADAAEALGRLAAMAEGSVVATFVPRTPLLAAMHTAGRLFPRGDRAPAVTPVAPARMRALVAAAPALADWAIARRARVSSGFYTSEAVELVRR